MSKNTEPVQVNPDDLIQNVYEHPDGHPDHESAAEFSTYLVGRMYGFDDEVAKKYKPGIERPEFTPLTFDRWAPMRPKTALIATVAASVAVNLFNGNAESLGGKIIETAADINAAANPNMVHQLSVPTTVAQTTRTIGYPIDVSGKEQKSGIAEKNELSADELVTRLGQLQLGDKVVSITIKGSSSDEWFKKGQKSLGRTDTENSSLAHNRAKNFASSVEAKADQRKIDIPDVNVQSKENVLSDQVLANLLLDVQKSQYSSVTAAISAYNNNDPALSKSLQREIRQVIGSKRDSIAVITVQQQDIVPGSTTYTPQPDVEVKRKDTKHPLHWPPIIPIPTFPLFRRKHTDPFVKRPNVVHEPLDNVWIELYQEALGRKNTLVGNAWSLTRKYQALYREDRVTQALRFDYNDDSGKAQKIDVLFVDRDELTEETVTAVSELMFEISMLQEGKVAENLDTIAIFPTEHAGPQKPDVIGLGIDEQYAASTLGVAIPSIGLVELLLPKNPTQKDLDKFSGFKWVLAHEVGGHFTDVNKKTARTLVPAKSNRIGRSFTTKDAWLHAGQDSYSVVGRRRILAVTQFAIKNPNDVYEEFVISADDPRLKNATSIRLRDLAPTVYGESNEAEIHAETAAAVITGIPIPAAQAGRGRNLLGKGLGYSVDRGLEERFVQHVGAISNNVFSKIDWPARTYAKRRESFKMSILRGQPEVITDADQNAISEEAKNQPYQEDRKRIKILAPTKS